MDFRFVRVASEGLGIIYVSAALCILFALLGSLSLFLVFLLLTPLFSSFFSGILKGNFLRLNPVP